MKTTVIYHSADYDGIFCREIAKHFLGTDEVEYIGWNFGDPALEIPSGKAIYVMDLPIDRVFGFEYKPGDVDKNPPQHPAGLVWIDHHNTSIITHPRTIPGYRIDGVAACRLAWQWFSRQNSPDREIIALPIKSNYVERQITEPIAVRLAGEYDIWDKRDVRADTFQYALRAADLSESVWERLLRNEASSENMVNELLPSGAAAQRYSQKLDEDLVKYRSFRLKWEGLDFLCLNTGRFNSLTFAALDKPETGHDALLGFMWNGKVWTISLYHAAHRKDLDLSTIALKHGGGGHKGACGFTATTIPFSL